MRGAVVLFVLMLSGCATPPADVPPAAVPDEAALGDPVALGALTSTLAPFDMGIHAVDGDAAPYLLHIRGETTVPQGDGPFPVVIIMHGRHGTCATLLGERLLQPCPDTPATASVLSYTGYRYLAEHLASHGMLVVSVDANNVNDHDNDYAGAGDDYGATARGNLVLTVLDELASGETFAAIRGITDLEVVGLMGHSRGGEGVIRAATLAPDRIDAVFALAPTDFARWLLPGMPFGTILPYCDGDVSNLQGAWAYDDMPGGPKHQFLHMGANHNFYNTIWTSDDWGNRGDPYCDADGAETGRLDAEAQRADGLAIMGTFFRYYLGNGEDLWPLLQGSAAWPFDVKVSADFEVGHSQSTTLQNDGTTPFPRDLVGSKPTACAGATCPIQRTFSPTAQLHLFLPAGGSFAVFAADNGTQTLRSGDAMTVRIGLHPETNATALAGLTMFAEDADGARFTWRLVEHGLFVPPGEGASKTVLNMVRLDYDGMAQAIDMERARGFGFEAEAAIELQFADWYALDAVPGGPRFSTYH